MIDSDIASTIVSFIVILFHFLSYFFSLFSFFECFLFVFEQVSGNEFRRLPSQLWDGSIEKSYGCRPSQTVQFEMENLSDYVLTCYFPLWILLMSVLCSFHLSHHPHLSLSLSLFLSLLYIFNVIRFIMLDICFMCFVKSFKKWCGNNGKKEINLQ